MTEESKNVPSAEIAMQGEPGADETSSTLLPGWLQGQLAQLYADVMREPLPKELLDLVGQLDEKVALQGKSIQEASE